MPDDYWRDRRERARKERDRMVECWNCGTKNPPGDACRYCGVKEPAQ
jgi:ribosomal protein L32